MIMETQRERGQSLVLIALAAIVLIAFVGLAVDGGMAYAQRRVAQNAADGAALRGAQLISDEAWRYGNDQNARRIKMLKTINEIVQVHGVPDTNADHTDEINGNVKAYYTRLNGVVYDACDVATCTTIPTDTFGIQVSVVQPFPTYFAGIIGWNEIKVSGTALGLARIGPEGNRGNQWALFASDRLGCSGPNGYEVDVSGASTNEVRGNAHSNGSFSIMSAAYGGNNPQITYVNGFQTNLVPVPNNAVKPQISLAMPSFGDYFQLGMTQAPPNQTHQPQANGTYTYIGTANGNVFGADGDTAGEIPYTYVNGNLVISNTNNSVVMIGGLIVVNGNVTISAPRVQGQLLGVSIIASGTITTQAPNSYFQASVFQDPLERFDPLVWKEVNRYILWSNANLGAVACTQPAIFLSTGGYVLTGAVMAPTGRVDLINTGTLKRINGTVIADTINIAGSNMKAWYNSSYFPPQPDFVELME